MATGPTMKYYYAEITTNATKLVNHPIKLVLLFLEFVAITCTPATLCSQYSDYADFMTKN